MAAVNVYLPDDLASLAKERGLPISQLAQRAIRMELQLMTALKVTPDLGPYKDAIGPIDVEVGSGTRRFQGSWIVWPDEDATRGGNDLGAYWGIALTARGRFAVYRAHCNDRWPAELRSFDTLDELRSEVPHDVSVMLDDALGRPVELDI